MHKTDIIKRIRILKNEKNALILAHYYQPPEIQDLADFVGDSLDLSRSARDTDADIIVFCGVEFMAETAKILDPSRTVLLPVSFAGCLMADMLTADTLNKLKKEHPNAAVVCYINSSAQIKAVSDICCTSSNAVNVIGSLDTDEVIFVPDRNLGSYVARFFPEKKFYYCDGFCPVHDCLALKDVQTARRRHPDAKLLVHPECRPEMIDSADFTGSTSQIIRYAKENSPGAFIIATESGMIHQLMKVCPDSEFFPIRKDVICHDMKLITPEDVMRSLESGIYPVEVENNIASRALRSIERMLEIS